MPRAPKAKTKETRIGDEKARLLKLLVDVPQDRLSLADKLVDDLAFMAVELEDLKRTLSDNGWTCEYKNGENQFGTKRSPEADIFIALAQRQLAAFKQVVDLLPDSDDSGKKKDALLEYVGKR